MMPWHTDRPDQRAVGTVNYGPIETGFISFEEVFGMKLLRLDGAEGGHPKTTYINPKKIVSIDIVSKAT